MTGNSDFNAGTAENAADLDATRVEGQARADAVGRQVHILRHVGGTRHGRVIRSNGTYLWRDVCDGDLIPYPVDVPWAIVETLDPADAVVL